MSHRTDSIKGDPLGEALAAGNVKTERHRWVKLVIHKYVCRKCGTGKVNAQVSGNFYETTYHTPDGRSRVLKKTPPCEVGQRTAAYLAKYAKQIEEIVKPLRDRALADPTVQACLEAFPAEVSDFVDDFDTEGQQADGL